MEDENFQIEDDFEETKEDIDLAIRTRIPRRKNTGNGIPS